MRRILAVSTAVLAIAVGASDAAAASFNIVRQVSGDSFGGDASADVRYSFDGSNGRSNAGAFALKSDPLSALGEFLALCVDLENNLSVGGSGTPYHVSSTSLGFSNKVLTNLDRLFSGSFASLDLNDANQTGGFQTAAWDIVYDSENGGLGVGDGEGKFFLRGASIGSGVEKFAQNLIANLGSQPTGRYNFTFLQSELDGNNEQFSQNLVVATPVPLPAAGWMLISGAGALMGLGRLQRRKA